MTKKTSDAASAAAPPSNDPPLIICRNKHWRYISCYHGPWFQLPPELLQSLANENYAMPAPRLIDPAVFFDIVKIRYAVDEAMREVVRANSGTSPAPNYPTGRQDPFGMSSQPPPKMSKERIHKVRQKAVKLLSKAYTLDEVATSVVTMQSSSSVQDIAGLVLKRDKDDLDARYVHFFHEKVPARLMENHTSVTPLSEIIESMPWQTQAAPFRTRGVVGIMKNEPESAADDFTSALHIAQELRLRHKSNAGELVLAKQFRKEQQDWAKTPRSLPRLSEDEQPSSMEQQLLFYRAGTYLTLACRSVDDALDGLEEYQLKTSGHPEGAEVAPEEAHQQQLRLAARKRVKMFAKRACKDYVAFLAFFDYTPGYPVELARELLSRIRDQSQGQKASQPRENGHPTENGSDREQHVGRSDALVRRQAPPNPFDEHHKFGFDKLAPPEVFPASALFAEKPFTANGSTIGQFKMPGLREAVTYHPLLTEALHSLLLCHSLLQTSPTELHRHAHSAARLSKISDGQPIFQSPRSPARADWIEVLRRCDNWIKLEMPWVKLCQPDTPADRKALQTDSTLVKSHQSSSPSEEEAPEKRRERIQQQALFDALGDERVVDDKTFQANVRARERQALLDEERDTELFVPQAQGSIDAPRADPKAPPNANIKGWAKDQAAKEYPIISDRATAVARWISEAPLSLAGAGGKKGKKKKRVKGIVRDLEHVSIAGAEEDE